jgi:hypothetical protein
MKECTRCGKCCQEEICHIGKMAFGDIMLPCPALIKENNIYSCAFIKAENDFKLNPLLAQSLGIGRGYDSAEVK